MSAGPATAAARKPRRGPWATVRRWFDTSADTPVAADAATRVDWLLSAFDDIGDAQSTRVNLTHSGVEPGSVLDRETTPGWEYLLESLKKLLER